MLQVIYEDNHLIAVNKPAGILVQGDETGDASLDNMVKHFIKVRYNKPGDVYLATLHRIDRPTSGVVVFARTSKAAERMSKLFQTGGIEKTYLAITNNRPDPLAGRLEHYLVKNSENNTVKAYSSNKKGGKLAVLEYEFMGQMDKSHQLIKVNLHTGRSHHIRVQLAKIGSIIHGDLKYGAEHPNLDMSISLHCRSMSFVHPVTQEKVIIKADLPKNPIWKDISELLLQENL
ncbi:MAG TPA: RluA family pseudouridine synthase, partial [Saprospiraceae bacterium]|nr:RluA family pseudouridine synthase [Saprospiraceae bacterium]